MFIVDYMCNLCAKYLRGCRIGMGISNTESDDEPGLMIVSKRTNIKKPYLKRNIDKYIEKAKQHKDAKGQTIQLQIIGKELVCSESNYCQDGTNDCEALGPPGEYGPGYGHRFY